MQCMHPPYHISSAPAPSASESDCRQAENPLKSIAMIDSDCDEEGVAYDETGQDFIRRGNN